MYTVKGYVGSEEKLRTYFAGCAFEKKPRVLFVTDEILPDHITCFEYLDSIRRTKNHKEPDDILEGPLTDYESWMPDFLGGLAKGIENSRAFEEGRPGCGFGYGDQPEGGATELPSMEGGYGGMGNMADFLAGIRSAVSEAMAGFAGQAGDIIIPVYVGGTLLDRFIFHTL